MSLKKCEKCPWREQYKNKLNNLENLLNAFPPYHGHGYNYTKEEVEAWLLLAKRTITIEKGSKYT